MCFLSYQMFHWLSSYRIEPSKCFDALEWSVDRVAKSSFENPHNVRDDWMGLIDYDFCFLATMTQVKLCFLRDFGWSPIFGVSNDINVTKLYTKPGAF